ncbi:MAG: gamma-glutamyltransferase family protein [Aigarchaeota archaeon]|nr:gamma-glutamyltransferase family protein [Aigarchaeota archaeon]MCX8192559.1 gamma-glutamyltransferase family protein [Nitrososphaeria archaeon]MDW7985705.1 gamma-glutamyltransferase [Nitrososphaerota archaeon]
MSGNIYCLGENAIASHSPIASSIALKIMEDGGNAVDAVVTASLLLNVVEPGWSGLGGGGFALIYSEDVGFKALDYREVAPLKVRLEDYRDEEDMSIGYKAVAVPGTLKGLWMLHQEFGKIDWKKIIDIVMKYAESCPVSRLWSKCMSLDLDRAKYKLKLCHESYRTFLKDGEVYSENSKISYTRLAETLKMIKEDIEYFYEGELAEEIEKVFSNNNGFLSSKDLSRYKAQWREPIVDEVEVKDKMLKIVAMPPPSSAILLVEALKILSQIRLSDEDYYLKLIHTLFHIIDERCSIISDPLFNEINIKRFLSDTHIKESLQAIEEGRLAYHLVRDRGGTSHISVVDNKDKMYVSLTETIECFMGSGITIRGILMNDEIHDFTLQKGHPNTLHAGKRPASSMSPLMLFDQEDTPLIVIGASGGMRIISSMIQSLSNYLIRYLDPVSSILNGRIHIRGDEIVLEDLIKDKILHSLIKAGLKIAEVREVSMYPGTDLYFGAVQAVFKKDGLFLAVSDPRKQAGAYAR